ncbi:carboxylesterase family protein [Diplodia corticola]|uniref:Carboxylic ester hydrolase n=1 Tax=Diplodia corticola TaxID=236234 RepID=A0A1J9RNN9_9PEZI|nr:carboxylesterase family protein [Diplodia corticola]OJD30095.1 carboxylesterase family protein [Diplodia corticola]
MLFLRSVAHAAAAITLLSPTLVSAQNSSSSLPVVDLGYGLHRAISFNETRAYYNFSNIRYAAPPVGELRFKAPEAPVTDRSVINDGSIDRICPQSSATYRDPRETEDCLFLDVIVPEKVFLSASNATSNGTGAPVLVWIYGGGYTSGSKAAERTPSGLIQRGGDGVIYVAMNYRVGAFGWLAGPTLQQDGTANAGLHDQRFALEWVQANIHLFGGDKDRVTVFGESAGGGSIIHQITAYGGASKAPFQRAIAQSPAWLAFPSLYGQDQVLQNFLAAANATTLAELRTLPSASLIAANAALISNSANGLSSLGPAIDGSFVPQDPKSLLAQGRYDTSVGVMVGHNTDESHTLTPAAATSDAIVDLFIAAVLPNSPPAIVSYIANTLYPPVSNGSANGSVAATPYTTPFARLALLIGEATILCNAHALAKTNATTSHAYRFGVAPGYHGQDVPHTYYDPGSAPSSGDGGASALLPFNATVATVLQDYITSFAIDGAPASAVDGLGGGFPVYGEDARLVALSGEGVGVDADEAANERCEWWGMNYI